MRFVLFNPLTKISAEDRNLVKGIAAVKQARPVQARTLQPQLRYRLVQPEPPRESPEQERRQPAQQQDRRVACRRINHMPVLEELRAETERRQNRQRETDSMEHIDKKI